MREGRTKKTGKLLIALLLRAEARGLFLQPSRGPATQTRTRGLGEHDKTTKELGTEPVMVQGFEGWAPEGLDSRPRTNGQVERANGMILQGLKPRIYNRLKKFGKK